MYSIEKMFHDGSISHRKFEKLDHAENFFKFVSSKGDARFAVLWNMTNGEIIARRGT